MKMSDPKVPPSRPDGWWSEKRRRSERRRSGWLGSGWLWGFGGVLGFSLTLPATQVAVPWFGPAVVSFGRAALAGVLACLLLWIRRERAPFEHWKSLLWISAGVVVGFPFFSAWAMERTPASHGAVMLAILPLATAGVGAWRAGERPGVRFWLASALASAVTVGYALWHGAGRLVPADLALFFAAASAAAGYAEGGRLAQQIGGWRVISWALAFSLPVTAAATMAAAGGVDWTAIPFSAWLSGLYVSIGSQWLLFFAWYYGLAVGGVARVSQLQYLQVFLTLAWSALWLRETVTPEMGLAAVLVVAAVAWGKGAPVGVSKERLPKKGSPADAVRLDEDSGSPRGR